MGVFDEDAVKRQMTHEVGQDLSRLSRDELTARIDMLRGEIQRIEAELHSKSDVTSAAEALFRRN